MNVKVAYKNHGELNVFKLTEDNFVGRTMTVSKWYHLKNESRILNNFLNNYSNVEIATKLAFSFNKLVVIWYNKCLRTHLLSLMHLTIHLHYLCLFLYIVFVESLCSIKP